jgi:hypothetical protein
MGSNDPLFRFDILLPTLAGHLIVSESVDRILSKWSIDRTGPLTRSLAEVSTSGWIDPNAAHWSIEPFLPIETAVLIEYLRHRGRQGGELDAQKMVAFESHVRKIQDAVEHQVSAYHRDFANRYHAMDPDSDCRHPDSTPDAADPCGDLTACESPQGVSQGDPPATEVSTEAGGGEIPNLSSDAHDAAELMELFDQILSDAAYEKLTQDDIEQCVGKASPWGVPLKVDFGLFKELAVYARGDIIGRRCRRHWKSFYRAEMVDVAIYQRLVVLFQLAQDHERGELLSAGQLHLRIFKNIPKQDVDMLLPGTKVRLSKFDQAKVIVPSIGGWLMSLQKISKFVLVTLALAAYYSTALVVGLLLAAVAYMVKSFMSYFQTRNRYLLDLTRNLYFQKLDTNTGAGFQIIQQAGRQLANEAILAVYSMLTESEPISERRLRRKCERLMREAIDVEVDFQVAQALRTLRDRDWLETDAEGKFSLREST